MMANPRIGQVVQVWYRAKVRDIMPFHGRLGTIRKVSKPDRRGSPRNHLVEIDDKLWSIPCGNLRLPDECPGHKRGGTRSRCCKRAGEYNGYGSDGPLVFICPRCCSCHD